MAIAVLVAALGTACGKKGPPLPPIVHIPTAVDRITARRIGTDVFVTLTVPVENVDKTMPADVGRIEVYGYTGTSQPPKGRFLDVATHVATVDVVPPEIDTTKKSTSTPATPTSAPSARPPDANVEAKQGAPVTVRDHLDADALVARAIPPGPVTPASRRARTPSTTAPVKEGPLKRYYLALAFSPRGRPGPPGNYAELALSVLPDPPRDVVVSQASDAITLTWEPSGGVVGVLLEQPLPFESSPIDETAGADGSSRAPAADVPPGPTLYNVYREIEPLPDAQTEPAVEAGVIPSPINGAPLTDWTFSEPLPLLDGRRRCYTVRGVRGTGATAIEGDASVPVCISPIDDIAPAAPMGLSPDAAVAGQITLTWEPNAETDLAGYVVLRGEAGDATLTPLTGSVIAEPRFVDQTVKPGVRYVYAVKAIDSHLPTPNVSAESARVEETAR